ncbi:MAG: hypothetical protein KME67_19380 [Candidatus Thiodiazotropha sp. (ex Codakia orbicularis)]|nr:hypothetical protein [Candidatus Thiodiazotropha sp. (ex Codakia orbicularis)]
MEQHIDEALGFFVIGFQYLDLSEKVSSNIAASGNKWMIVQEGGDWIKLNKEYDQEVKWSDHQLGIPVLFNFYHGLELLLKGLLRLKKPIEKNHKLPDLLNLVESEYPESNFLRCFKKYVHLDNAPEILNVFFEKSSANISEWYQALKYPESTKGKKYHHVHLKYQEESGGLFFAELSEDIHYIRVCVVSDVRSKHDELA